MLLEGQEESLVSRLQKRDPKAWKEFYDFYSSSLTYVCMRYIIKQEDVQDILQDSLVKMYHAIEKFEYKGKGALQAWATRIVVNESLKFLRKEKYNFTVDEELIEDVVEEETSDFEGVSQEDIFEMIRSLPDGYRAVFNLYVFEQKSHKEIGQLLGIAENSSASQFHRAKGILSQRIKEFKKLKVAL